MKYQLGQTVGYKYGNFKKPFHAKIVGVKTVTDILTADAPSDDKRGNVLVTIEYHLLDLKTGDFKSNYPEESLVEL